MPVSHPVCSPRFRHFSSVCSVPAPPLGAKVCKEVEGLEILTKFGQLQAGQVAGGVVVHHVGKAGAGAELADQLGASGQVGLNPWDQ